MRVYTRAVAYLLTKRVFHSVIKRCKAGVVPAVTRPLIVRMDYIVFVISWQLFPHFIFFRINIIMHG